MLLEKQVNIIPADAGQAATIYRLVCELASYEHLLDRMTSTEADIRKALGNGDVEALVAFCDDEPVGFALFYMTFSSFSGRRGLYIEDLFVCARFRGQGIGKRLLNSLGNKALERNCCRMTWQVLDWNRLARGFYEGLGGVETRSWIPYGMDEATIRTLTSRE